MVVGIGWFRRLEIFTPTRSGNALRTYEIDGAPAQRGIGKTRRRSQFGKRPGH